MSTDASPAHLTTCEVRLSFPHLFEMATTMKGDPNAKDAYQATLLIPPGTDMTPFTKAMQFAAQDKWGANIPPLNPAKNPIKDCATKTHISGYEPGWFFIRTKTERKPVVVDQQLNEILDKNRVYAGCWVKARIHAFAYTHASGNGISFGLDAIQFIRDGDRFDGGFTNAKDVFEPVAFEGEAAAGAAPAAAPAATAQPTTSPAGNLFG